MRIEFCDSKNHKKVEVELFQPKSWLKFEAIEKFKVEFFSNRKYQGYFRGSPEKTNQLPFFKVYNKDFLSIRHWIFGSFGFCCFIVIWPRHKEETFCCVQS